MIERAIKLRDAIELYVLHQSRTKDTASIIEDQLTPEDWQELVDLRDLLEPMKTLTIRLQGNATTGSHGALWESLGAMELLLEKLETKKKQYEHLPSSHFKACIKLGWKKLEKYYQLTDESPVYRAAIFLHPRHKWTWFRKHWRKSHPDWIISAKIAVTALWQEYKQRYPPTFEQQQHHEPDLLDSFMDQDVEGDSDSEIEEQFSDEFERYAYEAVAQNERDPLRWWRDNAWRYPTLCRLAFDLLAVLAMSAECELDIELALVLLDDGVDEVLDLVLLDDGVDEVDVVLLDRVDVELDPVLLDDGVDEVLDLVLVLVDDEVDEVLLDRVDVELDPVLLDDGVDEVLDLVLLDDG
ncbi:hypothetical protein B0A49_13640, partial [Cryomyces minteri]